MESDAAEGSMPVAGLEYEDAYELTHGVDGSSGMAASVFPIQDLLPELLSKVFIHCLPTDEFVRPSRCAVQVVLLQVCSLWRDVALHTPGLWCSMKIPLTGYVTALGTLRVTVPFWTEIMRTWVERSGCLPLSIHLDDYRLATASPSDAPYKLLLGTIARCKNLKITTCFPSQSLISALCDTSSHFPMLEGLEMGWIHASVLRDPSFLLTGKFASLPALRRLECHWPIWHMDLSNVPWTQLTCLGLHDLTSARKCLQLLEQCHVLESCTLAFDAGLNDIETGSVLQLDNLVKFAVERHCQDTIDAFISRLRMPSLLHLSLHTSPRGGRIGSIDSIRTMLGGASGPVEELNILASKGLCFNSIDDYWKIWEFTRNLKKLNIEGNIDDDPFGGQIEAVLSKLCVSPDGSSITYLPRLEELYLSADYPHMDPPSEDTFRRVVHSRLPQTGDIYPTTRLRNAELSFRTSPVIMKAWHLTESGEVERCP
ncbi:hypothetical protein OE88DRAFT_1056411 [Heliocybe sulcata]|uniref:F-box domain-containing protein n=1 Tax=Heliocybe sulcata TaxID=5364 RepID=A0A5C3MMH4_9AGAM|nr:hypothetical protein OE88DRAFT_1056411 [Heliocybe sulcata]